MKQKPIVRDLEDLYGLPPSTTDRSWREDLSKSRDYVQEWEGVVSGWEEILEWDKGKRGEGQ